MAGENDGFNGSTVTFPTDIFGGLRSLEYSESGPKVNVTGSAATNTSYRTGVPDLQLTATWVGGLPSSGCDIGTIALLNVDWADGTDDGTVDAASHAAPVTAIVVDRGTSGSMDGEITSTVTFAIAQPDGV